MHVFVILMAFFSLQPDAAIASERKVVVYSARKEHLIKPVFSAFTKATGIDVTYVTDKAPALVEKIKAEGQDTHADMLMTVDAGNLWYATQSGILQATNDKGLTAHIPEHLRQKDGFWYGLTVRARTIAYSTERVKSQDLSTYADLGDARWKGRLCLRTAKKVYNQSLVAMFIASVGEQATETMVKRWIKNLAAPVFSSDTKLLEAIAAGQCDVGIVNTYYYGRLKRKNPAIKLALFWPDQQGGGVHVNVSGAGITKYAKNPREAKTLLKWLANEDSQRLLAKLNLEYPANPQIQPDQEVQSWGKFKPSQMDLGLAGEYQKQAIMLMDRARYR